MTNVTLVQAGSGVEWNTSLKAPRGLHRVPVRVEVSAVVFVTLRHDLRLHTTGGDKAFVAMVPYNMVEFIMNSKTAHNILIIINVWSIREEMCYFCALYFAQSKSSDSLFLVSVTVNHLHGVYIWRRIRLVFVLYFPDDAA